MKVIDISQEALAADVYPGDPRPAASQLMRMEEGALYNLSAFSMCAHSGTHIDAPFHFIKDGKTVEEIDLFRVVGACFVVDCKGELFAADAERILEKARAHGAAERILLRGTVTVTAEAAAVFAKAPLLLLGNEGQTVGPIDAPMEVHKILLGADVVLLEGIVLKNAPEGKYFLNAAPLNLAGFDGAPTRAYLIEL